MPADLETLVLKIPRGSEVPPELSKTFISSLTQINNVPYFKKLFGIKPYPLALEIVLINQQIRFQITCDRTISSFVQTQIQSSYPLVIIEKTTDPIQDSNMIVKELKLRHGNFYPLLTYEKFTDVDPLAAVLNVLAKTTPEETVLVQFALESIDSTAYANWQAEGMAYTQKGPKNSEGIYTERPDTSVVKEKISYPGFRVSVRLAGNTKETLNQLTQAFGVFTRADANSFSTKRRLISLPEKVLGNLRQRYVSGGNLLNIMELATLWHLPSEKIKTPMIAWGTSVLSEPPDNLPAAINATEETKKGINFFGKTIFKNRDTIFGIKDEDRRRHIWVIGKTGTGKSTLIANMAIDDLKKGRGLAVIDPHGDLCEIILDYVPKDRINDVVYFNPYDKDYPIVINPLEVTNKEEAELVVSGIVSIFNKIFGFSWGPRLEYILRNTLLTLSDVPATTLKDVPLLLTNAGFRQGVVAKIKDPTLKSFWIDEFEKMPPNLQKEAISPILNKVGQFVTSPLIRTVIGHPRSTIKLDDVMNQGKILLANLSDRKSVV